MPIRAPESGNIRLILPFLVRIYCRREPLQWLRNSLSDFIVGNVFIISIAPDEIEQSYT
jgi:hypothetical protein